MIWIAHIICLLVFLPGLLVTIPVHMCMSLSKDFKSLGAWLRKKNAAPVAVKPAHTPVPHTFPPVTSAPTPLYQGTWKPADAEVQKWAQK